MPVPQELTNFCEHLDGIAQSDVAPRAGSTVAPGTRNGDVLVVASSSSAAGAHRKVPATVKVPLQPGLEREMAARLMAARARALVEDVELALGERSRAFQVFGAAMDLFEQGRLTAKEAALAGSYALQGYTVLRARFLAFLPDRVRRDTAAVALPAGATEAVLPLGVRAYLAASTNRIDLKATAAPYLDTDAGAAAGAAAGSDGPARRDTLPAFGPEPTGPGVEAFMQEYRDLAVKASEENPDPVSQCQQFVAACWELLPDRGVFPDLLQLLVLAFSPPSTAASLAGGLVAAAAVRKMLSGHGDLISDFDGIFATHWSSSPSDIQPPAASWNPPQPQGAGEPARTVVDSAQPPAPAAASATTPGAGSSSAALTTRPLAAAGSSRPAPAAAAAAAAASSGTGSEAPAPVLSRSPARVTSGGEVSARSGQPQRVPWPMLLAGEGEADGAEEQT